MWVWFFPYVSFSTGFQRRLKNICVHNFLKLFRIILAFMFPTCVTHRIHMIFTWHSLRQCMLIAQPHREYFKTLVIIFWFSFLKNWHDTFMRELICICYNLKFAELLSREWENWLYLAIFPPLGNMKTFVKLEEYISDSKIQFC